MCVKTGRVFICIGHIPRLCGPTHADLHKHFLKGLLISGALFAKLLRSAHTKVNVVGTWIRDRLLRVHAKDAWAGTVSKLAHPKLSGYWFISMLKRIQFASALLSMQIENWGHFFPFSVTHVIKQVEFYPSCLGKKICGYGGEICGHIVFVYLQDFEANEDLNSIVHHSLITYEEARYVRFHPTSYSTWPCVRVEIYVIS